MRTGVSGTPASGLSLYSHLGHTVKPMCLTCSDTNPERLMFQMATSPYFIKERASWTLLFHHFEQRTTVQQEAFISQKTKGGSDLELTGTSA